MGQATGLTQEQQTALVRRALDLGVNLIDTSVEYRDSESILGEALKGVPRDSYILSTKWPALVDGKVPEDPHLLIDSVEQSLRRLGTDHVEIMLFHGPAPHEYPQIVERFYPTMERLREQGKVRFIGVSTNYLVDPAQSTAEAALKTHPELWDLVMLKYGILNQHAAKETLPLALEQGIGILNMAPVRIKLPDPKLLEELITQWKEAGQISADSVPSKDPLEWLVHDEVDSVISAGYKFAADHPAISTVITGTTDIAHLEANVAALERPYLPPEDAQRVKDLFSHVVEYA